MHLHIISRKRARQLGMKHYFTGKPCPKGHISLKNMWKECLACKAERKKVWRLRNIDHDRAYQRAYQEENREYFREWNKTSPKADAARKRRVKAAKNGTLKISDPVWQRIDKTRLQHLRQMARQYEEWTGIKFEVDHIVPVIDEKVCGLHWHGNWQLIPMRLNRLKRGIITHATAA